MGAKNCLLIMGRSVVIDKKNLHTKMATEKLLLLFGGRRIGYRVV